MPTKDEDICSVIRQHVAREEIKAAIRHTRWLLAMAYQQGYRRFDFFDPYNIRVGTYWLEKDGKVPFNLPTMMKAVNDVQGVMASMNLMPVAKRQGNSLASIRSRAVAQVIASSNVDEHQLRKVQDDYVNMVATLGTAGLQAKVVDSKSVGLTAEIEVVHPRELFPFPSVGWNRAGQAGIVRQRWFSLEELAERHGNGIKSRVADMDTMERRAGEAVEEPMFNLTTGSSQSSADPGQRNVAEESFVAVKVRELYTYGERGTLAGYYCCSGRKLLHKQIFEDEQAYCPLVKGIFWDIGDFYGAGLYDILFSSVREFEKMIKDLVNNTRDIGRYPVTMMPHGVVNEKTAFKDTGYDMRLLSYQMDPSYVGTQGDFRPITIMPHQSGDLPGRTAQFLNGIIDQVSPIRNLIDDKGRGDSLPFMQFLDDENKRPLTVPVKSMVDSFADIYRYVVCKATGEMMKSPRALPITQVDLGLLGAQVDWEKLELSFDRNPLPDVSRLSFSVKETSPRRESLRKQEAVEMLQIGLADPTRFMLLAAEEGLDFALWMKPEEAAYLTVVFNCLQLYNDGQTPGGFWVTPYTERPDIQLRVLQTVMGGLELRAASKEVIDLFVKYQKVLTAFTGAVLPPDVPDPYSDPMLEGMLKDVETRGRMNAGMPQNPALMAGR